MLGRLEAQPVLCLEVEHLELQHRVERRPTAFRLVGAAKHLIEHRPEQLEVDNLQELLQRIAEPEHLDTSGNLVPGAAIG